MERKWWHTTDVGKKKCSNNKCYVLVFRYGSRRPMWCVGIYNYFVIVI